MSLLVSVHATSRSDIRALESEDAAAFFGHLPDAHINTPPRPPPEKLCLEIVVKEVSDRRETDRLDRPVSCSYTLFLLPPYSTLEVN